MRRVIRKRIRRSGDGVDLAADLNVTIDAHVGRFLRRLDADVRLELEVPEAVRDQLGDLVGGRLKVRMRIDRLNRPVRVAPPG